MSVMKYVFWNLGLLGLLSVLSCSTGYNQYANEYFEQGLQFYAEQEYGRSIESFSKVLELAPEGQENNVVFFNRGQGYYKQRQYDLAISDYTNARAMTPEDDREMQFDIYFARGSAYLAKGLPRAAIKDYSIAIEVMPEHDDIKNVYTQRGWAYIKDEQLDEAIADFSEVLAKDMQYDPAYYGRGMALYRKGQYDLAIFDAKKAHKLKPENSEYDDLLFLVQSAMKTEKQ